MQPLTALCCYVCLLLQKEVIFPHTKIGESEGVRRNGIRDYLLRSFTLSKINKRKKEAHLHYLECERTEVVSLEAVWGPDRGTIRALTALFCVRLYYFFWYYLCHHFQQLLLS